MSHLGHHSPAWHHSQIYLQHTLGMGILQLHITTCYCENLAVIVVVHMICQHYPITKALNLVKHDPHNFYVSSTLHALDHIDSNSSMIPGHLEHKLLIFGLPWRLIIVHILEPMTVFQRHDIVHKIHSAMNGMLWTRHKVLPIRGGPRCRISHCCLQGSSRVFFLSLSWEKGLEDVITQKLFTGSHSNCGVLCNLGVRHFIRYTLENNVQRLVTHSNGRMVVVDN
jgi:hypothetical protein